MTYDRETNQVVLQDSRAWIAGLGDEGGAGSWLAAIMKQFVEPNKEELDKYHQFFDNVLWRTAAQRRTAQVRSEEKLVLLPARSDVGELLSQRFRLEYLDQLGQEKLPNAWIDLTTTLTWRPPTGFSIAWRAIVRAWSLTTHGTGICQTVRNLYGDDQICR